ncbi:MAG: hypothetical protein L3J28_07590 [Candidatus Polarisedimenticolaceae bacterium]|nr:hypothetical protein [Candidatus Polarisedimenticolaceae bacterium]
MKKIITLIGLLSIATAANAHNVDDQVYNGLPSGDWAVSSVASDSGDQAVSHDALIYNQLALTNDDLRASEITHAGNKRHADFNTLVYRGIERNMQDL